MKDHGDNLSGAERQLFEALVAEGYDPLLASLHASGRFPGLVTNSTVTRGMGARQYSHQLGQWIETDDYRHNVKRIVQARNMDCEGVVSHRAHETAPVEAPRLASDIVERIVEEKIALDPGLASKSRQDLRAEVVEKHGRPANAPAILG